MGLACGFRGLVHCQDGKHGGTWAAVVPEKERKVLLLDLQAAGEEGHF